MNLKVDQRQIVEQIKRQLQISESYSEHRYLPIMEGEEHLIQSKDGFDFFLIQSMNRRLMNMKDWRGYSSVSGLAYLLIQVIEISYL